MFPQEELGRFAKGFWGRYGNVDGRKRGLKMEGFCFPGFMLAGIPLARTCPRVVRCHGAKRGNRESDLMAFMINVLRGDEDSIGGLREADLELLDSDDDEAILNAISGAGKMEMSEEEQAWRYAADYAMGLVIDTANESPSLDGLRPIAEKRKKRKECIDCLGTGMRVCAFCGGRGVANLDAAQARKVVFRGSVAEDAKKIAGQDLYLCPFCGGLRKERCLECLGSGIIEEEPKESRSLGYIDDVDKGTFTENKEFGYTIWRRKKRPGRTPRKKKEEAEKPTTATGKKRRGRPKREESEPLELPPLPDPKANAENNSTGFLSTTSYQVQQSLSQEFAQEAEEQAKQSDAGLWQPGNPSSPQKPGQD